VGAHREDSVCPACGRYVGPARTCAYCDLDQPENQANRGLRVMAWCLTVGGFGLTAVLALRFPVQCAVCDGAWFDDLPAVWRHPALLVLHRHVRWIAWCLVVYLPLSVWTGQATPAGDGRGRRIRTALWGLAWYVAGGWVALVIVYGPAFCCATVCTMAAGMVLLFVLYPIPRRYAFVGFLLPLAFRPGAFWGPLKTWIGLAGGGP
jgi:hypothetical protein